MSTLSKRIKDLRDAFGINQEQLRAVISNYMDDISIGVVKGWEQNKTKTIKSKYSIAISNHFKIDREWLEDGKGEMRINKDDDFIPENSFKGYDTNSQSLNNNMLSIPFYEDIRASAGTGCINGECKPSYIKLVSELLPTNSTNIEAIRVMGDSMLGSIDDGDVIFIDKNHIEPLSGKIYVVFMCDEVYVKRIFKDPNTQKLILKSDNPVYPQFEANCEDFKIIGKVIANMNIKEL